MLGAAPDCRVAYVGIDPAAVAHAQAILADDPGTCAVQGDVRDPAPGRSLGLAGVGRKE